MNTADLIQRCHNAAKSKGFWDKERNMQEAFALILSELYEAFDAHRKGKFADLQGYKNYILAFSEQEDIKQNTNYVINFSELEFQLKIKDSFEDEIADVLIRIFDFCFGFKMDIFQLNNHLQVDVFLQNANNIGEKVLRLTYVTSSAYYAQGSFVAIQKMYNNILSLCQELNIDIETHIELKLAYNATRSKLHGKNY